MSIHEQITAFLDGELTDESALAELMHVLAVSPEKRGFLVEQARMSRAMSTMARSIAPSASADATILAGISAMAIPAVSSAPSPVPRRMGRTLRLGAGAIALAVLSFMGGYFWHGDPTRSSTTRERISGQKDHGLPPLSRAVMFGMEVERGMAEEILAQRTSAAIIPLTAEIQRLRREIRSAQRIVIREPVSIDRGSAKREEGNGIGNRSGDTVADQGAPVTTLTRVTPIELRPSIATPKTESGMAPRAMPTGNRSTIGIEAGGNTIRRRSVGVRTISRLSLPSIYGLPAQQTILTDRELTVGLRLDEGWLGLKMPMGLGGAIGETRFSQSFRRQQGGSSISSIIEQTPNLIYGRAWIAPHLISTDGVGGGLELGGGGTSVGPFATIGLSAEYRPIDVISVDLGLSSWILWSQLEAQNVISANLNGHIGISAWF